jgi:hypothetical protein
MPDERTEERRASDIAYKYLRQWIKSGNEQDLSKCLAWGRLAHEMSILGL